MATTKSLYNPHDGLTGRDGGPYLDQEEARLAEILRAKVEGREPDFKNPAATAGTPLVTATELVQMANPQSTPSQFGSDPYAKALDALTKDKDFPVEAHSKRPQTADEKFAAKADDASDIFSNPTNATVVSTDDKPSV